MFSVKVALGGEISDALFIHVVADFPLFAFTEFVDDSNDCPMAIRCEIFFAYLTEDPSAGTILTVNELVDFDLVVVEVDCVRVMLCYKVLEIYLQFIGN